jgi:hypothetical protein
MQKRALAFLILPIFAQAANADNLPSYQDGWKNSNMHIYPGYPNRHIISNTSPWDTEVAIWGYTHKNNDTCKTNGFYVVELTQAPQHGYVCLRHSEDTIGKKVNGQVDRCENQGDIVGFSDIYFKPFKGFTGTDHFKFSLKFSGEPVDVNGEVTIEVKPTIQLSDDLVKQDYERQSRGDIPMCPDAVS